MSGSDRDVLGLVPARGGSKGVHRKNLRTIDGAPLIAHSIRAGLEADVVSSVVVSTEDDEIADAASSYGARVPFRRPFELATDEASTMPVIRHAIEALSERGEEYDIFVLLQPTSPLREESHVEEAFSVYADSEADSVISVQRTFETRWRMTPKGAEQINYSGSPKRRQDRTPEYIVNGAIYIADVELFLQQEKITAGTTALYEMTEVNSVDVDTPFDFWLVDKIITEWKKE